MVQAIVQALIFGALIAIAHFLSQEIRYKSIQLVSFSAGISVAYIFLDLFPAFSEQAIAINRLLFLSILLGFLLLHLAEKYIYQHALKYKRRREMARETSLISFGYHFIIGIVLVTLAQKSPVNAVYFFTPILLYTAVSTLPLRPSRERSVRILLASSTVLGVVFAIFVPMTLLVTESLLGIVIGVLSYTTIRHAIPLGKRGAPMLFLVGALLYTMLIIMKWNATGVI